MSNISEEDAHPHKRDSSESSSDPSVTSVKPVEGRIPKRQKKLPDDDPVVVQARKALEMFQELVEEDTPVTTSTKENILFEAAKTTETKITALGSPTLPKIHHRIPIISQQEELLL